MAPLSKQISPPEFQIKRGVLPLPTCDRGTDVKQSLPQKSL